MPLYAGVCETDITPPPDVWMGGYAARSGTALGVHDELKARVLALDDGLRRVVIVAADLIAFPFEMAQRIRQMIAITLRTTPDAVLLNASHTHGSPLTGIYRDMGETDAAYLSLLERKIIGAANQAAQGLTPAVLTYGDSAAQIGINRRVSSADGKAAFGANTAGKVLSRVQGVCVMGLDGALLALLFSHACHPTTMEAGNRLITGEWCGAACRTLTAKFAKEAEAAGVPQATVPIFLQGCAGDINPIRRGDWAAVEENGRQVAVAADAARWNAHGRLSDDLTAEEIAIDLPCVDGSLLPFVVQHLVLGGVHLLGFPAEMFVGYALDFARLTSDPVLSLGYCNGCWNYVPTADEFPRGGYEVNDAAFYYQQAMFTPDCDPLLRAAVQKAILQTER
jgi:neutral ceramidase